MKINEKDVELKRETAELAATVPVIPVGQAKIPGLGLGLNLLQALLQVVVLSRPVTIRQKSLWIPRQSKPPARPQR